MHALLSENTVELRESYEGIKLLDGTLNPSLTSSVEPFSNFVDVGARRQSENLNLSRPNMAI